jgi:predicted amidophosphoribosyltransferase
VQPVSVRSWWRAARAAWSFPATFRLAAWEIAARAARGGAEGGFRREFGERIAQRRCLVCATDDVALDGWSATSGGVVCADCSHAVLADGLAYGRIAAAYRGRAGSPRRGLGEVYQAIVSFKERRDSWLSHAEPLARALAESIADVRSSAAHAATRFLLVSVPSYRDRRPHVQLLTALAAVRLSDLPVCLGALQKIRDFTQKGLAHDDRRAESAGAYSVRRRWRARVRGCHVIVADDLFTTGTTLDVCARALLDAGAVAVDGAVIVRAIRAPPERMLTLGARQVRVLLRELDARGRTPVTPEPGTFWVQFPCSARCPVIGVAGPYPLPTLDAASYFRWMCRCGASHVIRAQREWRTAARECVAVGVGERRPVELLVGIQQGPATVARD